MPRFLTNKKVRLLIFLGLLLAGCFVHYLKYHHILPGQLQKIVEIIRYK